MESKGCREGKSITDRGCFIEWIGLTLVFVMAVLFSINGHDLIRYFCISSERSLAWVRIRRSQGGSECTYPDMVCP